MDVLSGLIVEHGKKTFNQWYTYKGMMAILERNRGAIATQAVQTAAGAGISAGAGSAATAVTAATTVATVGGIAIGAVSFGAVLGPWIAVAEIARQSGTIFSLYDLKEAAVASGTPASSSAGSKSKVKYVCVCGGCAKAIQYIIDKKERNVGRMAIAPFTGGISVIVNTARSISKMFEKGRPKELNCKALINSSRAGCTVAIATIFLLAGNWEFLRGGNAGTMRRAISMITSEDGWETLREAF
jgi:hypothetical protein